MGREEGKKKKTFILRRGEVSVGIRIVPAPCTHNPWLMTAYRTPLIQQYSKKKQKTAHAHTHTLTHICMGVGWLRCHGNVVLQLSSAHQFPQQHHKRERERESLIPDIIELRGLNEGLIRSNYPAAGANQGQSA